MSSYGDFERRARREPARREERGVGARAGEERVAETLRALIEQISPDAQRSILAEMQAEGVARGIATVRVSAPKYREVGVVERDIEGTEGLEGAIEALYDRALNMGHDIGLGDVQVKVVGVHADGGGGSA